MKRTLLAVICLVTLWHLLEVSDATGLKYKSPHLDLFRQGNGQVLTWSALRWPVLYCVEVLDKPPERDEYGAEPVLEKHYTLKNTWVMDKTYPYTTYWRVAAISFLGYPLGYYSNTVYLDAGPAGENQLALAKPVALTHYTADHPASVRPVLIWSKVEGAVYYDVEYWSAPPGQAAAGQEAGRLLSSQQVYVHGCIPDFASLASDRVYWRVQALDYDGNPIGLPSDFEEIIIDRTLPAVVKPLPDVVFNQEGRPTPLYPVYAWIPLDEAVKYEVEITDRPPENPNGTAPSRYRIWRAEVTGPNYYDEMPRVQEGTYYWRVRGLDADGRPVGVFSDAQPFTVDHRQGAYAASFGDSITHGGGGISYSPSDWEYDYQTYLKFPCINLGKSGDTAEAMLARFDADVLPYHPRYLLILGGTNSLRGGASSEEVMVELAAIRDKCLANGIRPIFLTLPPINPGNIMRAFAEETVPDWRARFDAVNAFIRQQPYVIDIAPYLTGADGLLPTRYAVDGLHPDIEGKKIIAQVINANWARVTR